jgi:hypothetical protein
MEGNEWFEKMVRRGSVRRGAARRIIEGSSLDVDVRMPIARASGSTRPPANCFVRSNDAIRQAAGYSMRTKHAWAGFAQASVPSVQRAITPPAITSRTYRANSFAAGCTVRGSRRQIANGGSTGNPAS